MSFLALYRRYRPTTFDKVIGQDHIVQTLINQIKTDRIGHAYLFTGSRGTGKTSTAKIFAKAINCKNPVNGSPCGKCECCLALNDPSNIEVLEIDAASNNGVNEIRELRENVQYPPVVCRYKVYIIDEVHMLTGAAFNALLKTLEEPPKHVVFILATTEVHKIPATILSRCMRFDFRLISTEQIASLIASIYDEVGKEYEKEAVNAIAVAGEGSIRDALSIADTALSVNSGKLTYDNVTEILGSCNSKVLNDFVLNLVKGNAGKVLDTIDELFSQGKSAGVLIKDITAYIRNVLIAKTCSNPNAILSLPDKKFLEIESVAKLASENRLIRILEIFADAENTLRYSNHPRVLFETCAVKATRPDSDFDLSALTSRIKSLEDKINSGNISVTAVKEEETLPKQEEKVEKTQKTSSNKISVENSDVQTIRGKLLFNVRQNGHEMLWHLLQSVKLEIKGTILIFNTVNEGDDDLLSRSDNMVILEEGLIDFAFTEIIVRKCPEEVILDKIDEETEMVKKIFGNDIVIIKN